MTTKANTLASPNLPNSPAAIRNRLKVEAAIAGVNLKQHIEAILTKHLRKKSPKPTAEARALPLLVAPERPADWALANPNDDGAGDQAPSAAVVSV